MNFPAPKLLPLQLRRQAKRFMPQALKRGIADLERLLECYDLSFPFFVKMDSSRFDQDLEDEEYWLLERLGWDPRQDSGKRLIYVGEVIGLNCADEDSQIVSINSLSTPLLEHARPLDRNFEFLREDIQFESLLDLPECLQDKVASVWVEFLLNLANLLERMEEHQLEFEEFVEQRVSEYLQHYGISRQRVRHEVLEDLFHRQRRVELFHEFMELQSGNAQS